MQIQHTHNEKNGTFFIEENGVQIAFMTYVNAGPGKFIIEHTIVEPGNEGRGIGKLLVAAGVNYARENNLKIIPLCSFAKAVFDKTPDYADVLF